ncbi:MAG: VIT domain-containing protein [Elainellaceae cyanobacterium]
MKRIKNLAKNSGVTSNGKTQFRWAIACSSMGLLGAIALPSAAQHLVSQSMPSPNLLQGASVAQDFLLSSSPTSTSTDLSTMPRPISPRPISAQIAQASRQQGDRAVSPTVPNYGGLYVSSDSGEPQVFPLEHTDVTAQVSGNVARVEVTQTFTNPYDEPLEAIYVFPLPDEAAVDDMEIRIGDRIIRGDIKRREEAQAIYEQAVREGRTAGLLEQERANIFTQSLANIRPGEQIDVTIRYSESLSFVGNDYEFVFPMVVGPRYIPGNPVTEEGDTDQVPDASRITPPVLPPDVRSGHDIAVTVNLEAGVPVQDIESPSHDIQIQRQQSGVQIQLDSSDTIPNKDLIVRYQVAGAETQTTVLTQRGEQGGHFAAYLIPAVEYDRDEIVPKDVVFLMDTSGSQRGEPLAKSQELMRRMIDGLNPDDTFTIIDFANTATRLSEQPLANTAANRQRAIAYVNALTAEGGTELLNGMREVMRFPPANRGRLRSVVLLTDGYIGNEAAVIAEVQQQLKPGNRLYSFGVGSSVNRFVLDRLAEVGRGTMQVVRQDEPTEAVIETFLSRINNPVLTNIELEWLGDGEAPELYPLAVPDLFDSQPLVLFGRKADGRSGRLRITGTMAGGDRYEQTLTVNFDQGSDNEAIAQLWGRARIKDLMTQMYGGETVSGVEGVTETALDYRLLSQYTAFVAVSEEVRVDPDGTRRTVQVPVELPEGVSYEGIFGDQASPNPPSPRSAAMSRTTAQRGPARLSSPAPSADAMESGFGHRPPSSAAIATVQLEQLDGDLAADLQQELESALRDHLARSVYETPSSQGDMVWQIRVQNGRVVQVLFDDQRSIALSTVQDQALVNAMRRSLQGWRVPESFSGQLRLSVSVTP